MDNIDADDTWEKLILAIRHRIAMGQPKDDIRADFAKTEPEDRIFLAFTAASLLGGEAPAKGSQEAAGRCVWCDGGYIRETGIMCRTCHGTGAA